VFVRPLRQLVALACAAVLLVGCGEAVGEGKGSVSVAITKDFGAEPVVSAPPVGVNGSTSLLEVLDRVTDTHEGTRSITSIEGLDGAWRLWVNGVRVSNAGKAKVRPGDRVWLDLPGAGVTASVPAVTGSFPEPFLHGTGGKRIPTRVECTLPKSTACNATAKRLTALGVVAARGGINAGTNDDTIRVLVGTWSQLRAERDEAVARVDRGPQASGIWARFSADGKSLHVLDAQGATADTLGAGTGLVAATKIDLRDPVWFVTGTDDAGVEAAVGALDEATLTTGYALAVHDDRGVAVPAR
jgi:hypothetical protein